MGEEAVEAGEHVLPEVEDYAGIRREQAGSLGAGASHPAFKDQHSALVGTRDWEPSGPAWSPSDNRKPSAWETAWQAELNNTAKNEAVGASPEVTISASPATSGGISSGVGISHASTPGPMPVMAESISYKAPKPEWSSGYSFPGE